MFPQFRSFAYRARNRHQRKPHDNGQIRLDERGRAVVQKVRRRSRLRIYEIDIHSPDGTGTHLIYLDRTKYYTIPYRSLLPENVDNLLVAGRCISATHEAQSAYRIMPIICNIGESAGYAAAIAAKKKINCSEVDKDELHSLLDKYGVKYK